MRSTENAFTVIALLAWIINIGFTAGQINKIIEAPFYCYFNDTLLYSYT